MVGWGSMVSNAGPIAVSRANVLGTTFWATLRSILIRHHEGQMGVWPNQADWGADTKHNTGRTWRHCCKDFILLAFQFHTGAALEISFWLTGPKTPGGRREPSPLFPTNTKQPAHSAGTSPAPTETAQHIKKIREVFAHFQLIIIMSSAEVINHQWQLMGLSCILSHPSSSQLDIYSQEMSYALIAMGCDL